MFIPVYECHVEGLLMMLDWSLDMGGWERLWSCGPGQRRLSFICSYQPALVVILKIQSMTSHANADLYVFKRGRLAWTQASNLPRNVSCEQASVSMQLWRGHQHDRRDPEPVGSLQCSPCHWINRQDHMKPQRPIMSIADGLRAESKCRQHCTAMSMATATATPASRLHGSAEHTASQ
jgi:hypothetical protein